MDVCIQCEKEFTPLSQKAWSQRPKYTDLCPECAASAEMVECQECGKGYIPARRRSWFSRPVHTQICPECITAAETAFTSLLTQSTPRVFITPAMIVINVAVFVAMLVAGVALLTPRTGQLLKWGAAFTPATFDREWWRLLSSTFVHIGMVHLALNMWCLWSLGRLAERMFGNWTFFALYVLSGLGGSVASAWWNPTVVSAGASGAIFGIAGGLVAFWRLGKLSVPDFILKQNYASIVAFVGYNLFYGFTKSGIDNAAHLGGLAVGLALGALLHRPLPRVKSTSRWRAALAYGGVALALSLGVVVAQRNARPLVYAHQANALSEAGRHDQAIERYKQALAIKPDLAIAQHDLGVAYMRKGEDDQAIAAYERTIEISRDDAMRALAYYNLGVAYSNKELYDEQIEAMKKSLKLEPDNANAHNSLGRAYLVKLRPDAAIVEYQKALKLKPDLFRAHLGLGMAYEAKGLAEQAIAAYEQAHKLEPDDKEIELKLKQLDASAPSTHNN